LGEIGFPLVIPHSTIDYPLVENYSEASIQRVHREVIGSNGGPAYVAAAQKMLSDGGTLQDVRIFLVENYSEASIQRVHREVIGSNGGPAYVAAAQKMLSDGGTL
jgi:hypothetical protein